MSRISELSIRNPQARSLARATAFNRHTVNEFFTNLLGIRLRHNFTPQNIYNVDETGLTAAQKPVTGYCWSQTSKWGESCRTGYTYDSLLRGKCDTECDSSLQFSASPWSMAVLLSLLGLRTHLDEWNVQWMKHFIQCVKCSSEDLVSLLLLMDNRESHVSVECLTILSSLQWHCVFQCLWSTETMIYNAASDYLVIWNPRPMIFSTKLLLHQTSPQASP